MHIAYVSDLDARDVHSWSGSTYRMWRGLEDAGAKIDLITPLKLPHPLWYRTKRRWNTLRRRTHSSNGEPAVLRAYAKQVEQMIRLLPKEPDAIFGCGKPPVAFLETDIPLIFADDYSVPAMKRSHPSAARLSRKSYEQLLAAEQQLLSRASLAIYASDWAADAARQTYDVEPDKVIAIPWGANLDCDRSEEDVERLIASRSRDRLTILFNGVSWEGKRGALVLETVKLLHEQGISVELHILGCDPPVPVPGYVFVHGFISKANSAGQDKINTLYNMAHLLFVPTKADAYGIVFAEASSFGVPSISTAVGGVSGVVYEGQNGHLLCLEAGPKDYASLIQEIRNDRTRYRELARQSFQTYKRQLNWQVFGEKVLDFLRELD